MFLCALFDSFPLVRLSLVSSWSSAALVSLSGVLVEGFFIGCLAETGFRQNNVN